jgi:tetratricopeptide (TPR) repeat protein
VSTTPRSAARTASRPDPVRFARANQLRYAAARRLADGNYRAAIDLIEQALALIRPNIDSAVATGPGAFPHLQQAVLLLTELAFSYTRLGDPENAQEPLQQAQVTLERAVQLMPAYATVCCHGEVTYDGDGDCMGCLDDCPTP